MNQNLPTLRISGVSHVLAVASGKGGVGKTTVAVNLALALRFDGARVGLFDADLYGPNIPLMLGVQRKKPANTQIPIARVDSTPYIHPFKRFGLWVMSIGFVMGNTNPIMVDSHLGGQMIRQTLQDVLWGEMDFLVIDLPAGTGEPQQTLLKTIEIDGVLIVTTPQDLSLMDASRSLGFFHRAGVPILGVIENMSYMNCPHCDEPIEVFYRSERHWSVEDEKLEQLGRIPLDISISRGIDAEHPLLKGVDNSPEAMAFRKIASKVARKLEDNSQ